MRALIPILLLLVTVLPQDAGAEFKDAPSLATVGNLGDTCEAIKEDAPEFDADMSVESFKRVLHHLTAYAMCGAFVRGVIEGLEAGGGTYWCRPSGVDPWQSARIVMKWIDAHPEHRHEIPSVAVILAMSETFPCPNN